MQFNSNFLTYKLPIVKNQCSMLSIFLNYFQYHSSVTFMMFTSLPLSRLFPVQEIFFLTLTFLSLIYTNHQFKFSFFRSCFMTSSKVSFEHFIGEFMQPYDQVPTPIRELVLFYDFLFTWSLLAES